MADDASRSRGPLAPVRVAAPWLSSVAALRIPPPRVRAPRVVIVPPPSVPPPQLNDPITVRLAAGLIVPPLIVRLPEIVESTAIASVPWETLKVVPLETVRLLTESDGPEACVTVMPLVLIWASSVAVGTWWSLEMAWFTQFDATSQSPPAELAQSIVASKVR